MQRYLVENHGANEATATTAILGAINICKMSGVSSITLLVADKCHFATTVFADALRKVVQESGVKKLCQGETIFLSPNISMNLVSYKSVSPWNSYGMVIGVYLATESHDVLDSLTSSQAVMLLPWLEDEGKDWLMTWPNVNILGKNTWNVHPMPLPQNVESVLHQLTNGINITTGISHPSDLATAKVALGRIKPYIAGFASNDIRKWAKRNGWRPEDAKDLAQLAAKILNI